MGAFTDNNGDFSLAKAFGTVALGITTLGTVIAPFGFSRITDREYGLKTTLGQVDKVYDRGAGLVYAYPLIQSIHEYPLYQQTLQVKAEEAHFKTSDNQPILGGYDIQYELDPSIGDPKEPFTKFNDNIGTILQQQAKSTAVIVLGTKSSVDLTGNIEAIQNEIKVKLQKGLEEQKVPVRITAVLSDGIGLSEASTTKLEQVMLERQRAMTLQLREENAAKAKTVAEKEANVTVAALDAFKKAGYPDQVALSAYCLQTQAQEGHVHQPFAASCNFTGTGTGTQPSYSVSVAKP